VTPMLFIVAALVIVLLVLIHEMNHGTHYTPQAYHRRKTDGAPLAHGVESLGPRRRKRPGDDPVGGGRT
jgi:hypothetical protein